MESRNGVVNSNCVESECCFAIISLGMSVVILHLPRDILHCVYGEWLVWKDLSRLDRACVEKTIREVWLTSLTDLRISKGFYSVSDGKMTVWYQWLGSRKVFCMNEFVVKVDDLEVLLSVLDIVSFCPLLQSIEIQQRSSMNEDTLIIVKNNLSIFLSHCHTLQGVTVSSIDEYTKKSDMVLEVLIEVLRENSLVQISLRNYCTNGQYESIMKVANLLIKHACSIRDLYITTLDEVDNIKVVISTLIESQICLRKLAISLGGSDPSQAMPSLISYLTSSGGLLEDVRVGSPNWRLPAEDLLSSMAASCLKLTILVVFFCQPCSTKTVRRLYEQCPNLRDVSIDGIIRASLSSALSIDVKGSNDDWVHYLSLTLSRSLFNEVALDLREDYHYRVRNLKSMLEPYQIRLNCFTYEVSLISLLQDLPHLSSLHLFPTVTNQHTDATLAAISEHANSLIELNLSNIRFSDRLLSELIKRCQWLKRLAIDSCGWESLVAVSELSNLMMVDLTVTEIVTEEVLDWFLLDEKVEWSTALDEGFIKTKEDQFYYDFNTEVVHWVKVYNE